MCELLNAKKAQDDKELTFNPVINKNYKSNTKNTKPVCLIMFICYPHNFFI